MIGWLGCLLERHSVLREVFVFGGVVRQLCTLLTQGHREKVHSEPSCQVEGALVFRGSS